MSRSLIEFSDLSSLQEKIRLLPGRAEKAINQVLHTEGIEIVTQEMTNLIPLSRSDETKHAKKSKWSASEEQNLGFIVKSKGGAANKKGSYGYLVFPDEGRGPFNPWEQNFSGRAAQRATPKVLEKLHGSLEDLLNS